MTRTISPANDSMLGKRLQGKRKERWDADFLHELLDFRFLSACAGVIIKTARRSGRAAAATPADSSCYPNEFKEYRRFRARSGSAIASRSGPQQPLQRGALRDSRAALLWIEITHSPVRRHHALGGSQLLSWAASTSASRMAVCLEVVKAPSCVQRTPARTTVRTSPYSRA